MYWLADSPWEPGASLTNPSLNSVGPIVNTASSPSEGLEKRELPLLRSPAVTQSQLLDGTAFRRPTSLEGRSFSLSPSPCPPQMKSVKSAAPKRERSAPASRLGEKNHSQAQPAPPTACGFCCLPSRPCMVTRCPALPGGVWGQRSPAVCQGSAAGLVPAEDGLLCQCQHHRLLPQLE